MKLLFANGNINDAITQRIADEAGLAASAGTDIVAVTAPFGVPVVTTEEENAVACEAVLQSLRAHAAGCDAAVIAISFDSALEAAQRELSIPVIGITQAALHTACLLGPRIGLITFGSVSRPLYEDLLTRYGLAARISVFEVIEFDSLAEYTKPEAFDARVASVAMRLATGGQVDVIVICGAANAGMARRLRGMVPIPIVDGVTAATRLAETLVTLKFKTTHR